MVAKQLLAPLPGIFYRRPSPDKSPFKQVGDAILAGDTVGLVEVMKSFFPIESDTAGKLIRFLVEDGEAVEAEQAVAEME